MNGSKKLSAGDVPSTAHWTDKDWDIFKSWIHGLLVTNNVSIKFEKADGTIREMKCTLREDVIPKSDNYTEKTLGEAITVFDIEKNDWRKFKVRSVKEVNFTLGE